MSPLRETLHLGICEDLHVGPPMMGMTEDHTSFENHYHGMTFSFGDGETVEVLGRRDVERLRDACDEALAE